MRLQEKAAEKAPDANCSETETTLAIIFAHIQAVQPALVVIDSIKPQSCWNGILGGSISQVRECAARLRELAKPAVSPSS